MKHTKNNHRIMKNNKFGLFRINSRRKERIKKKNHLIISKDNSYKNNIAHILMLRRNKNEIKFKILKERRRISIDQRNSNNNKPKEKEFI